MFFFDENIWKNYLVKKSKYFDFILDAIPTHVKNGDTSVCRFGGSGVNMTLGSGRFRLWYTNGQGAENMFEEIETTAEVDQFDYYKFKVANGSEDVEVLQPFDRTKTFVVCLDEKIG